MKFFRQTYVTASAPTAIGGTFSHNVPSDIEADSFRLLLPNVFRQASGGLEFLLLDGVLVLGVPLFERLFCSANVILLLILSYNNSLVEYCLF